MSPTENFASFQKSMKKHRTSFLLISLLIIIVVSPLTDSSAMGSIVLGAVFSIILLLGVYVISYNLRLIAVSLLLMIPASILIWIDALYPTIPFAIARYVLSAVTIFFILFVMLKNILSAKKVTTYEIYGALSVYLLVALAYSQIYLLFYNLNPGSIYFEFGTYSFSAILYFSFVCLATVGFGDIVAVAPLARSIVILEATTGVFFVAILIARLIGSLSITAKN